LDSASVLLGIIDFRDAPRIRREESVEHYRYHEALPEPASLAERLK
jgi:hypothetical protein